MLSSLLSSLLWTVGTGSSGVALASGLKANAETATESSTSFIPHELIKGEPLAQLFALMDHDGDGGVSVTELRDHFLTVGASHTSDLNKHTEILSLADQDGDGYMSYKEMQALMPSSSSSSSSLSSTSSYDNHAAPPQQLHLACTGDVTTMLINFVSLGPEKRNKPSVVVDGVGSFTAEVTTYTVPSRYVIPCTFEKKKGIEERMDE